MGVSGTGSEDRGELRGTGRPITPRRAVALFVLLLAAYSVNSMDRMVFPVLLPDVRAEYGFTLGQAGLQSTVFALGMGAAGIPAGILLARLGRKPLLVSGTVIFSAATALTVVSVGFADMLLWRVLSGVGEAMQLAAIITIAAGAFPRRRGIAIGAVNMAFATGSVVGPVLATALSDSGTWRTPLVAFGLFGIVVAAVVAVAVPRRFTEPVAQTVGGNQHVGGASTPLNPNTILLATITVLFGLVDFGYIGLYATFLREELGFSPGVAGLAVGVSGLAAFASPIGGLLTDRLDPRLSTSLLSVLTGACGAALFLGPTSAAWQVGFSFLFGLFASSGLYVVLAGLLVRSMRADLAGHASGTFITCIYGAAGVAGYLLGILVDRLGWSAAGLMQICGLSLIGALLALLLRPSQFSTLHHRPGIAADVAAQVDRPDDMEVR